MIEVQKLVKTLQGYEGTTKFTNNLWSVIHTQINAIEKLKTNFDRTVFLNHLAHNDDTIKINGPTMAIYYLQRIYKL
jgi:hypothetical protein